LFCCFIEGTMTVVKSVGDGLRDCESETQLNLNRPLRISPGPRHLSRPLAAISTSDNMPEPYTLNQVSSHSKLPSAPHTNGTDTHEESGRNPHSWRKTLLLPRHVLSPGQTRYLCDFLLHPSHGKVCHKVEMTARTVNEMRKIARIKRLEAGS